MLIGLCSKQPQNVYWEYLLVVMLVFIKYV